VLETSIFCTDKPLMAQNDEMGERP